MRWHVPSVIVASVIGLTAIVVCGLLGWWQWDRAHSRAETIQALPPAPLGQVLEPATAADFALGRLVKVEGTYAEGAALVAGRNVDGTDALFLVREFTVGPDATGTGAPATLPVLVGWHPADDVAGAEASLAELSGPATVSGYLRASEEPCDYPVEDLDVDPSIVVTCSVSAAELAQVWPAPLYSAVLSSDLGADGWTPLPQPEPETHLNFQSVAYAIEWWVFGAFAAFVAGRWIRDNGRIRPDSDDDRADGDSDDHDQAGIGSMKADAPEAT